MHIIKADGKSEEFSEKKLLASIHRAGIPAPLQSQVLMHIKSKVHAGMHTSEIYQHIIEFLDTSTLPYGKTRYSLKQSLMDLGPTGYPFEDYLARLLQHIEYQTTTRVITQGKCISHEIDVIATKQNEKVMVEAKFHNSTGIKTDVHVGLYTYARFEDVKERNHFMSVLLITNTKATSDVITYAQCVGMSILGWGYPEKDNLQDLVERFQLFPITALGQLTASQKQQLLTQGITLCKDLCINPHALDILDLPDNKKEEIFKEANFACQL